MNKKIREILEKHFNIYESNTEYELENWTDGGVDMFINIDKDKNIIEELEKFIENVDIDEEIEILRQNDDYKMNFTIKESLNDFENWLENIKDIVKELRENEEEFMNYEEFYLSIILYDLFLKEQSILLDIYYNDIKIIYKDYIKYDNKKKALIESINDYIDIKKEFILNTLKNCIED